MNFNEIQAAEAASVMPTYGRFPVALCKGQGATVTDPDGKQYIDFGAGIGVNSLGYCDTGWTEAISRQAATLQHVSNLYYTEPMVTLAGKLTTLSGLSKVFFGNSGAEANECAIKVARKYSFDKYGAGRSKILTLKNGFHGRTVTTLSATGQEVFHNYFFPFTEGFDHVPAGDFSALQAKTDDTVCAVMMEMIQGEGGVHPLSPAYVTQVAEFCKAQDLLLIVDEVQTGIGRIGSVFAYKQFGIQPDIVTLAKGLGGGLPIGACLASEALGDVLCAGTHGSTFGGNPVVCAGANYVLDTVSQPEFLQSVQAKGEKIRGFLSAQPNVAEVRGLGLMVGVALKQGDAKTAAARCLEQGLLVLTAKDVIRLLPPLNISETELEQGLNILAQVIHSFA